MSTSVAKRSFRVRLENWAKGLDYCAVAVPEDVTRSLGTVGPVAVSAQINGGKPFLVSLFPVGGGRHYVRVKANVRKAAGAKQGDLVLFEFSVLDQSRTPVPEDLRHALQNVGAFEAFNALTSGKKSYMIRLINEAAKPETRRRRIAATLKEVSLQAKKRTGLSGRSSTRASS